MASPDGQGQGDGGARAHLRLPGPGLGGNMKVVKKLGCLVERRDRGATRRRELHGDVAGVRASGAESEGKKTRHRDVCIKNDLVF